MTWWRRRQNCARISELKVEPGSVTWKFPKGTHEIRMTPSQCVDAAHALLAAAREAERMKGGVDSECDADTRDPPRWR